MTKYSNEDPDNYPDSTEYTEAFTEWLFNEATGDTLRKCQTATIAHVPRRVADGHVATWAEYVGNLDDGKNLDTIMDIIHLVAQDDYMARPDYWTEAQDWAYANYVDAATDAHRERCSL